MTERVQATYRRAMTPARMRRIYALCGGVCYLCQAPVPERWPGVTYEHPTQLWLGGPDEDDEVRLACDICVRPKNAEDARVRGKVRRLQANQPGAQRKDKPRMKSRPFGFSRPFPKVHRPIQSRGFR